MLHRDLTARTRRARRRGGPAGAHRAVGAHHRAHRVDLRHAHPRSPSRSCGRRCSTSSPASTPSSTAATSTSCSCSTSWPRWPRCGRRGATARTARPVDRRRRRPAAALLVAARPRRRPRRVDPRPPDARAPAELHRRAMEGPPLRHPATSTCSSTATATSSGIDVVDGTLCVNPGSPTYPHNLMTQLGTLGFLDIDGRHRAGLAVAAHRGRRDGPVTELTTTVPIDRRPTRPPTEEPMTNEPPT